MDTVLWLRNEALIASHPPIIEPDTGTGNGNMMVTSAPMITKESERRNTNVLIEDTTDKSDLPMNTAPFEREYDISNMILECIILLCQTRIIRTELRSRQVYVICRNYDIEVNQDRISELMNEIVQLLMRDESNDELTLT